MQKTFRSRKKLESEKRASGCGGKSKIADRKLPIRNELLWSELTRGWEGGFVDGGGAGSYRSVKFKKPWNNINLLQIPLPSFLSWINLISLSPVQSWNSISISNWIGILVRDASVREF